MPGSTISFLSLPHQLRLMHRGAGGLSKKVPFLHGRSAGRSWTFLTVFFYSVSANKTLSTEGQDMLHINEGNVQQSLRSYLLLSPTESWTSALTHLAEEVSRKTHKAAGSRRSP